MGTAQATDIFLDSIWNDAPDTFSLGETAITHYANDTSGNTVSATQTIAVKEAEKTILGAVTRDNRALIMTLYQ